MHESTESARIDAVPLRASRPHLRVVSSSEAQLTKEQAQQAMLDIFDLGYGRDNTPHWQDSALCAQTDPDIFFPEKGGSTTPATSVCAQCPVRAECLEYAISHDIRHGIWGGMSDNDRRRISRDRRRQA